MNVINIFRILIKGNLSNSVAYRVMAQFLYCNELNPETKVGTEMTHSSLWTAIDNLAKIHGKSCSALAKGCGLDSTTFNPSKRVDKYGKPRWPSSQTISKILGKYNLTEAEFFRLGEQARSEI